MCRGDRVSPAFFWIETGPETHFARHTRGLRPDLETGLTLKVGSGRIIFRPKVGIIVG